MDKELFKQMFSEYCHNEINASHCDEGDCLWCPVNMAWDKIFCCDEDDNMFLTKEPRMLNGIFEDENDDFYWMDCLDEHEIKEAKYFTYENECVDYHECIKSALYYDMTGYVDKLQNEEENLCQTELYVVLYNKFEESHNGLSGKVDFGLTKEEIIENVKNQKYVEGATYFTIGHMFFATRMMTERMTEE